MFTRHTIMAAVVVARIVALIATSGLAQASPSKPIGHPLEVGCQANVAINTRYGMPGAAMKVIIDNGGSVLVEGVGPDDNRSLTIQMTIKGWTLYEDSELWGDLRDYEIEGTCLPSYDNATYIPIVIR